MPSRNIPDRADAVKEAPKCRAYRWSSSTQPRTNSSVGASCCEGLSPPSAIPGADSERTASVSAQSIREHFGSRTADIQNRPANGRQPSTTGTPLRWRTATEIRASSSEMPVEPRRYTTACAVLKQPDKQIVASGGAPKANKSGGDIPALVLLAVLESNPPASVVRHTDGHLCRAVRARVTFSRMSEAFAVQMRGFGFLLWLSM